MMHIRRHFLSGLIVVIPLVITFLVVRALFLGLDNIARPFVEPRLGFWPPGLGIILTLLAIWVVGVLARNILFRRIYNLFEQFIYRLPVAKVVYSAVKQILETFSQSDKQSFKRVVLVEYPSPGIWTLGFVNGDTRIPGSDEKHLNILIFLSLNPSSGIFIIAPENKTVALKISVEEGLKWAVSGGIVKPAKAL